MLRLLLATANEQCNKFILNLDRNQEGNLHVHSSASLTKADTGNKLFKVHHYEDITTWLRNYILFFKNTHVQRTVNPDLLVS